MKVVVAYNDDTALKSHLNEVERAGENEVSETAKEIAGILSATILAVTDVRSALEDLRRLRPDVVVNLCEGVVGRPAWEMHFALGLEMLRIPATSGDPISIGICNDKILTRRILGAAGVSTPRAFDPGVRGRWIVKPSREDAGIGIDASSVCDTPAAVADRRRWVEGTYRQPALVEEFIDGRELNQAMFFGREGLVLLPPGEIVFAEELAAAERVVGWKAKWDTGSREERGTVNRTPALIDATLREDLAALCSRAASVLSIRGYCRMDVRQRADGGLCLIDVNPNPDIGRDTGFRKALAAAGIEFADFLNELMISASPRHP